MSDKKKEQQVYKEKEGQIEKEIEFYIFQDLENVLCLLGELEQTINTFQDQEDKSYLPIATNKAILQANLSYGIHYDQYCQHNNKHEKILNNCNSKAREIFKKVVKESDIFEKLDQDKEDIKLKNPKIQEICEFYLNKSLEAQNTFHQLPLEPVSIQPQFNQKCLEKVIIGTQIVDQQLKDVKNYKPPTAEQIQEKILKRKKDCEQQLKKNFYIKTVQRKDKMEIENNQPDKDDQQTNLNKDQEEMQIENPSKELSLDEAVKQNTNEDKKELENKIVNNDNDNQLYEENKDVNKIEEKNEKKDNNNLPIVVGDLNEEEVDNGEVDNGEANNVKVDNRENNDTKVNEQGKKIEVDKQYK